MVLNEMVRVNRMSSVQLGRAAGTYVAIQMENPKQQLEQTECDSLSLSSDPKLVQLQLEQRKWLEDLKNLVLRSIMPFEGEYSADKSTIPRFDPSALLQTPEVQSAYQLQCKYTLQVRRDQAKPVSGAGKKLERNEEIVRDAQNALLLATQNVAATSLTLVRILGRVSRENKDWHLERIAIVNGGLDNLDLSGAHLSGAFIQGTALGFKCEKCDLSYGEFGYFHLPRCADLRDSNVDAMKIDYAPAYRIDLRGTNWQKIIKFDPNEPTKQAHLDHVESPDSACEVAKSSSQ